MSNEAPERTTADFKVGDRVIYKCGPWSENQERGKVTSINDHYVFVEFDYNPTSKACRPQNLTKA